MEKYRYLQQDTDWDHCTFDQQLCLDASDTQNCWSLDEPISTHDITENIDNSLQSMLTENSVLYLSL